MGIRSTPLAFVKTGPDESQELKIADMGCGTGASTLLLAEHLNATITAIDLFPEFFEVLNSRISRDKVKG